MGTSICEMLNRASSISTARGRVGINGTRMSKMFDGTWVNTIVFTSPKRLATRAAANADNPANRFAPR